MARRLIVNADDYGLSPGVSRGIRCAYLAGLVSSTTAMMNMPGVEGDLLLALRETPRLGLGVHLVLTAEHPTLAADQVSGLVSPGGRFTSLEAFTLNRDRLSLDQVRAEWTAQIERFVAATGRPPDHLDSHHHATFFTAGLFRVFLDLAREFGSAIRCVLPALGATGLPGEVEGDLAIFAPPLLAEYGPHRPRLFCADFYDGGATYATLASIFERLPEGDSELMCHPAEIDERLLAVSSYARPRQAELDVLTSARARAALEAGGLQLISFGELTG